MVSTPSLKKSFKFQSDWPYNNSQIYLLESIIEDLTEDEDRIFKTKDDGYYFQSSVNYPNNKSLAKQNVYINKKMNITKVEVTNNDNKVQISMKFDKINYNKSFDDDYFDLSKLINVKDKESTDDTTEDTKNNTSTNDNSNNSSDNNSNDVNNNSTNDNTNNNTNDNDDGTNKTKETATIDDVIYPMYLPDNTTLANKETVDTEDGQRLILTFDGDNPFILIEETISYQDEGLIIPVNGQLDFLTDVIGVIGDNSLTWESNGIEYYMVSSTMKTSELIEIAQSISVLPVSK